MTDPTLNVDHPLYWQLKCYELREQRDDSAHQCFVAKKELSELQARLEAAELAIRYAAEALHGYGMEDQGQAYDAACRILDAARGEST